MVLPIEVERECPSHPFLNPKFCPRQALFYLWVPLEIVCIIQINRRRGTLLLIWALTPVTKVELPPQGKLFCLNLLGLSSLELINTENLVFLLFWNYKPDLTLKFKESPMIGKKKRA